MERNDYYAFGGKHANTSYPQLTVNRQKYNGKELQTIGNTNFIDYGARMYDDAIGRWGVVDPMAENYASLSGYNYGLNNPVRMIDKDGRKSTEFVDKDEKKNNEEPNWFQRTIATTFFSIINTAKLYGDNHTGKQTEKEKLAAGFNLFTSAILSVQGGLEMLKPSGTSGSSKAASVADDVASAGKGTQNVVNAAESSTTALTKFYPANNGFLGATERTF